MNEHGFKRSDMEAMARAITAGDFCGKPLSEGFKDYSEKTGKAVGSIRNLYYAVAKLSRCDEKFRNEFLCGKPVAVNSPRSFTEKEERDVISDIERSKESGVSVRKATLDMANGDVTLALRYQNKYRSVKAKREDDGATQLVRKIVPNGDYLIVRLRREIDRLTDEVAVRVRRENASLKMRIANLTEENARLKRRLYGKGEGVFNYFFPHGEEGRFRSDKQ